MAGPMLSVPTTATMQIAQQKGPDPLGGQQVKPGANKFDAAMNNAQTNAAPAQGRAGSVAPSQTAAAASQGQAAGRAVSTAQATSVSRPDRPELRKFESQSPSSEASEASERAEPLLEPESTGTDLGRFQTSGSEGGMLKMIENLEAGQKSMDRLIQAGLSGRQFSNAELLTLQASMYQYTQELDLTAKCVEKATTGLKDTLKTQV